MLVLRQRLPFGLRASQYIYPTVGDCDKDIPASNSSNEGKRSAMSAAVSEGG